MDAAALAAVIAAVVGVLGTLASALLTQRRSDAARREERELAERSRRADREEARNTAARTELRACYVALNTAARQYLTALNDHAHALRREQPSSIAETAAVEAARTEYRQRYAEAQMTVPDAVLAEISRANRRLGALYGALARNAHGTARPGDDLASCFAAVDAAWDGLAVLRHAMRADLGITEAADGADPAED
ncbi:hypothetical protein GCM10009759_60660 [Kitasatospora saccharophila]|uniref:Uncharacterized protein n=1 Tax=Kitasatospora saccharophila TaxID=407973 RepID=A0ABP5JHW4_9ACTN